MTAARPTSAGAEPSRAPSHSLPTTARPVAGERLLAALSVAALVAIALVAIFLRFHDLATNPGGLYPDEAAEAVDARRLLQLQGLPPVWFPSDGGREALFGYLVAAGFAAFGQTVVVLRATAAAVGVAGVVAMGLLGWRFGRSVGVIAAAWAAGSLWLVSVSRDGMRNGLVPLLGAVALTTAIWWADSPSRGRAIATGALVALAGLYTYQPLKLLPLLALLWLAWLRRADRPRYEAMRRDFLPAATAFLVIAAPMIVTALVDPANYFGRMVGVTPVNPTVQTDETPLVHIVRTLGMFTFVGDPNARHDVAGMPLLGPTPIAWALFVVGCAGVVRLWRRRHDPAHALILIALPLFFLPPLPAVEGSAPHFLRALGLAAPLAITIGLGAVELAGAAGRVRIRSPLVGVAAGVVVALVLGAEALSSGAAYFSRPVADRYFAYSYDLVALADAARPGDAVLVPDDLSVGVVQFLDAGRLPAIYYDPNALARPAGYARILGVRVADLAMVADRAGWPRVPRAIAWAPDGRPTVWVVTP